MLCEEQGEMDVFINWIFLWNFLIIYGEDYKHNVRNVFLKVAITEVVLPPPQKKMCNHLLTL